MAETVVFTKEEVLLKELFAELDQKAWFLDGAVYVDEDEKVVTLQYLLDEGEIASRAFSFSTGGHAEVEADLMLTAANWRARWGDSFELLTKEAETRDYELKLETFWVKLSKNDKENDEEYLYPYSKPGLAQFRHTLRI